MDKGLEQTLHQIGYIDGKKTHEKKFDITDFFI